MGTLEAAPERVTASILERVRAIDRAPWIESAKVVLTTRAVFFVMSLAGSWLFATETTGPPTEGFITLWDRWDVFHFVRIADGGYFGVNGGTNSSAFFPLFPMLMRLGGALGLNLVVAGMVISTFASIVAGAFLYRLAEEDIGDGAGRRALMYLFLFPTAVFMIAAYSEAVFLAGAIPAFYYARRGHWLTAGIPAAVAVGARAAGIFLLAGLVVEYFRRRDFSLDSALNATTGVLLGGLPLLGFGVFLARATGNAFHFLESQKAGWGREFVGPVAAFTNTWNTWNSSYFTNWMFAWRLEIVTAFIGFGIVVWVLTKKEWGYATYMGLTLAALVTSSWYYSIPRVVLTWFPIMLLLAGVTKGSNRRHEVVLLFLMPLSTLGVLLFTRNIWVF